MNREKGLRQAGRKLIHRLVKAGAVLCAAWLIVLAATTIGKLSEPLEPGAHDAASGQSLAQAESALPGAPAARPDWGSEVLSVAREQAFELAPFAVANACGIGASSCFKCHNGTRAAAPKMDKTASPWHPDHKTVNDSCVGCHSGNARLIKKEIAHANLIKDPRAKAEQCANCHKSGDSAALLKSYQTVAAGGKKP